ncbi:MAG: hypothetical protein AAFO96_19985 [Bacteroidota bacterium]
MNTDWPILLFASNPKDTDRRRLGEEMREIEEAVKRSALREQFEIESYWAVRTQDLRRAMLEKKPRLVQFSGTGIKGKGIVLERESGASFAIAPEDLATFFELFKEHVEVVIFNASYSEIQAQAISQHIPHVIGIPAKVSDQASIVFSQAFYDALGAGKPISFAYQLGISALQLEGITLEKDPIYLVDASKEETERRDRQRASKRMGFQYALEETELVRMIRRLNLDEQLGAWHLVNCNRTHASEKFWQAFEEKEGLPFQFYFILSCPTQQPNSFVERVIYEIIEEILDDDSQAINYERDSFDRLKLKPLPLGKLKGTSPKKLKKYFSERFEMNIKDFESFLETGSPPLRYRYVISAFQLSERKWKEDNMKQYLEWMIQNFQSSNWSHDTQFIFFINFLAAKAYLPEAPPPLPSMRSVLNGLSDAYEACTLIDPLRPVPQEDLVDWFRDLGARNHADIRDIIDVVVRTLSADDQQVFQTHQQLNMEEIEQLQELVFQIYLQSQDEV